VETDGTVSAHTREMATRGRLQSLAHGQTGHYTVFHAEKIFPMGEIFKLPFANQQMTVWQLLRSHMV
jgi:hypothetical protein